jgi:hypothetical protein
MGTDDQEANKQGVIRSNKHCKYWTTKFDQQSLERRADWSVTSWTTITEDIRDWSEKQCCEFGRLLDNRCLVSGFLIDDIQGSISID